MRARVIVVEHAADVDRGPVAVERERARRVGVRDGRIRHGIRDDAAHDRAGRTQRRRAVRRRAGILRFTVDEVVVRIAEIADLRAFVRRPERERAVIADRMAVLQRSEEVVLRFVVVGCGRFAAVDVVGDLIGLIGVAEREVEEVAADRLRVAQELVGVAEAVVRRVGVRRIEPARALLVARGEDQRTRADRCVVRKVGIETGERAGVELRVDTRRARAVARVRVDDRGEALAVLRRIRAFDRFDERDVVGVELGADVAVEFLRNRHAVDDVVHVAVIAVDVHDAVRAARGTGELQEQMPAGCRWRASA